MPSQKRCCVPHCDARRSAWAKATLHSLPKKEDIKKKWIDILKLTDIPTTAYVCSSHFSANDYNGGSKRLKVTALPTQPDKENTSESLLINKNHPTDITPKRKPSILNRRGLKVITNVSNNFHHDHCYGTEINSPSDCMNNNCVGVLEENVSNEASISVSIECADSDNSMGSVHDPVLGGGGSCKVDSITSAQDPLLEGGKPSMEDSIASVQNSIPEEDDSSMEDSVASVQTSVPEEGELSMNNSGSSTQNSMPQGSKPSILFSDTANHEENNVMATCDDCCLLDIQELEIESVLDEVNEDDNSGDVLLSTENPQEEDEADGEVTYPDVQIRTDLKKRLNLLNLIRHNEDLVAYTGITSEVLDGLEEAVNMYEKDCGNPGRVKNFKLTARERIVLCLTKLKINMSFRCLSTQFGITRKVAAAHFYYMIKVLAVVLKEAIYWPSKEEILHNMPKYFKGYEKTRVILDCTEIPVEKPKCLRCRLRLYSFYKSCETIKIMVGISPSGMITFLSEVFGGRASDKAIFNSSGILQKLDPTIDAVMVDKGFAIELECLESHIELIIPPKLGKKKRMPGKDILRTNSIASARVHVERAIQRFKIYGIVNKKVHWYLIPFINDIVTVIGGLVNLQKPILADQRFLNTVTM